MKRFEITGITRLGCLGMFVAGMVMAAVGNVQGQYSYTTNADNTITITGYIGTNVVLNITNEINGLTVTDIGANAFGYCFGVTSITIPNSVTNIGDYAFRCTSLTNLVIGSSVITIGDGAFEYPSLTSVIIPDSVTTIGGGAFYACQDLQYLNSVTIGKNVTYIGGSAFNMFIFLTNVYFKGIAPAIDLGGFSRDFRAIIYYLPGTTGWTTNFSGRPTAIWNIFSYTTNSDNTIAITGFNQTPPPVSDVTIPNTINGLPVTSIGAGAFWPCTNLTSVVIPNSVTSIGQSAFEGCINLTSISIPDSITNIEGLAFSWCSGLTNVVIGNVVTNIGGEGCDGMFHACTNLTSVHFKGNAPGLGFGPFAGDINPNIYYLPGTTGWSTNSFDCPSSLWLPQISGDSSFGIQSNAFSFSINWASGMVAVVESCTNLLTSSWQPVQTNNMNADTFYFSDPNWTNHPTCFYRIRWR